MRPQRSQPSVEWHRQRPATGAFQASPHHPDRHQSPAVMLVRLIPAEWTLPLRNAVLRPNLSEEECVFATDQDATSFHVGVFLARDEVCGNATILFSATDVQPTDQFSPQPLAIATMIPVSDPRCPLDPGWQLRGMAVAPTHRKRGLGSAALQFAESEVIRRGGKAVWCNAREIALRFYLHHQYQIQGERYTIPDVGPHFFCSKCLTDLAGDLGGSREHCPDS